MVIYVYVKDVLKNMKVINVYCVVKSFLFLIKFCFKFYTKIDLFYYSWEKLNDKYDLIIMTAFQVLNQIIIKNSKNYVIIIQKLYQ